MRVLVTSTKPYDRRFLTAANDGRHQLDFVETAMREETAVLAQGHDAVCAFVNDRLDAPVLDRLHESGVRSVALRCAGLKCGRIGALGIDVYEEEADLFFEDLSGTVIQDDVFARLTTFPNVLITGHQAFFTREALEAIAATTVANLDDVAAGRPCPNRIAAP